jgi:hypothetical protein
MATPSYFREKAKQCRRLAAGIGDREDVTAIGLLALAEEFEAKAAAQLVQPSDSKNSEESGTVPGSGIS